MEQDVCLFTSLHYLIIANRDCNEASNIASGQIKAKTLRDREPLSNTVSYAHVCAMIFLLSSFSSRNSRLSSRSRSVARVSHLLYVANLSLDLL